MPILHDKLVILQSLTLIIHDFSNVKIFCSLRLLIYPQPHGTPLKMFRVLAPDKHRNPKISAKCKGYVTNTKTKVSKKNYSFGAKNRLGIESRGHTRSKWKYTQLQGELKDTNFKYSFFVITIRTNLM